MQTESSILRLVPSIGKVFWHATSLTGIVLAVTFVTLLIKYDASIALITDHLADRFMMWPISFGAFVAIVGLVGWFWAVTVSSSYIQGRDKIGRSVSIEAGEISRIEIESRYGLVRWRISSSSLAGVIDFYPSIVDFKKYSSQIVSLLGPNNHLSQKIGEDAA